MRGIDCAGLHYVPAMIEQGDGVIVSYIIALHETNIAFVMEKLYGYSLC